MFCLHCLFSLNGKKMFNSIIFTLKVRWSQYDGKNIKKCAKVLSQFVRKINNRCRDVVKCQRFRQFLLPEKNSLRKHWQWTEEAGTLCTGASATTTADPTRLITQDTSSTPCCFFSNSNRITRQSRDFRKRGFVWFLSCDILKNDTRLGTGLGAAESDGMSGKESGILRWFPVLRVLRLGPTLLVTQLNCDIIRIVLLQL